MKQDENINILRRLKTLERKIEKLTKSEMSANLFLEFRFLLKGTYIMTGIADLTKNDGILKKKFSILKNQYALLPRDRAEFAICLVNKIDQSIVGEFYISSKSFTEITGFVPDEKEYLAFNKAFKEYEVSEVQNNERSSQCVS
ncbi:hypothetical protein Sdiek1_0060 [Sulfurospirillum diekertiae]|uniref:Uncharacterized protein n=1 Tax=Sulfurospirillum diekertiae TaxID=1854492 RepID=A0A1Y0HGR3_9BACT|nr:hypothetical protein [Sulfurospirillum diekertiae]ARU47248.1 hypothetical protein Sdiek1_0060 [Sulfurospirillum diekertiae]